MPINVAIYQFPSMEIPSNIECSSSEDLTVDTRAGFEALKDNAIFENQNPEAWRSQLDNEKEARVGWGDNIMCCVLLCYDVPTWLTIGRNLR